MPNNGGRLRIPHVPSNTYKAAPVDGATVTVLKDMLGTTLAITFTRTDVAPTMEILSGTEKHHETGMDFRQEGKREFESQIRKVQEFAAVMRPDKAFEVAQAIFSTLSQLDEEQRARYGLPKIELAQAPSTEAQESNESHK